MEYSSDTTRRPFLFRRRELVILPILLVALLVVLYYSLSFAPQRLPWTEIVVAGDEAYPPLEFVGEDGSYRGFDIDLMHALSNELGVKVSYRPMPWTEAIEALESGQVDALMGMYVTTQRKEQYGFAFTTPYLRVPQAIFVRSGETRIERFSDLAHLVVGVQEGGIAHDTLNPGQVGDIRTFPSQIKALEALVSGAIDAHVGNQYTGQYYVQHQSIEIMLVGEPVATAPYAMATQAQNRELLRALDRGLRILYATGTRERIERKWLGAAQSRSTQANRLIVGLVVALTISIGFVVLLRQRVGKRTQSLREANKQLDAQLQERVRAQDQLTQTLGQLETLMQSLRMGVVVEDDQRQLRYANHRAWRLLGLDEPESIEGNDFHALAADQFVDTATFRQELDDQHAQDTIIVGYPLQHTDGRSFTRDHIKMKNSGRPAGHLWIYHDVTAQERNRARLQKAFSQQVAINEMSVAVGQATSTEEACRILFEHADALLDFDVFIVSFLDIERSLIYAGFCVLDGQVRSVTDLPPLSVLPESTGTQSIVIRSHEPAYIPDLRQKLGDSGKQYSFAADYVVDEAPDEPEIDIARSAIHVPMIVRGTATGVIQIQSYQLDNYTQDDVDLLAVLSNVAAAAIQNLRLYQSSESRAQQLALVNRIARSVGAALAMDDLLDTIYSELAPIMHADAFTVALYDRELDEIDFRLQIDKGIRIPRERVPLGEGLITHVIRSEEPLLIRDYEQFDKSLAQPELWGDMQTPISWLGVPMRIGHRLVGVVCVQTYESIPYENEDMSLLSTVSDQIAVAIERARLYDAVRDELAERQRLEEQLRQSHKMEAVGQLAGGIAHDFNNLLTVINGYSQLALESLSPDHMVQDDLQAIHAAGLRAARLTRQLLAFSRRQVLRPKVLSLNEVTEGLSEMLRRVLRENIILQLDLAPDLSTVVADPGQMEQVLLNLAVNAGDAMPDGGTLTITTGNVTVGQDSECVDVESGTYVRLSISDTGIGMSEEVQEHLFEPFYTTKEVGKGTGLGLATVYGIVTQSKGHIHCTSVLGQGTTFEILLPSAKGAQTTTTPALAAEDDVAQGHETLLLVEDEPSVRELLVDTLCRCGYIVIEADNGRKALDILLAQESPRDGCEGIHLVISDVVMPEMSGISLLEAIQTRGIDIKAILMSGYHDYGHDEITEIPGRLSYMQKPFSPMDLARRVRQVLDMTAPQDTREAASYEKQEQE